MTDISVFRKELAMDVPNCPYPAIDSAVRRAVISFCDDTHYWVEEHSPITLLKGISKYSLSAPVDGRIIMPDNVKVNGSAVAFDFIPGETSYLVIDEPVETDVNAMTLDIILKPSRDAQTVPMIVYEDCFEAIRCGALGYLMETPEKPWTNIQLSAFHKDEFRKAKSSRRAKVRKGFTKKSLQAYPREFI